MQKIQLDYQSDKQNLWLGMALLVLGVGSMVLVSNAYQQQSEQLAEQEVALARIKNETPTHKIALPVEHDSEKLALEVKQANAVILQLSLPWQALFEAFEGAHQNDIAVLSIEPDAQKAWVRISGEAKSLDSLPAYVAYLQKVPLFQEVTLLNHQIQDQDPQKPVRFMLQASWDMQR
jgi:Tfp pilus assembly protein PilN